MQEPELSYKQVFRSKPLFPYAHGHYMIFPPGIFEGREVGEGSLHVTEKYVIYFEPDTPEEIKQRLIKDYAAYYERCEANNHNFD